MGGVIVGSGCLMAAVACLMVVSCGKKVEDSAWWDGERERVELQSRLDLLKMRDDKSDPGDAGELAAARIEAERLRETRDRCSAEQVALLSDVMAMESSWGQFASDRLKAVRDSVMGRRFATFTTVGGKSYRDVQVVKVDEGGVSIRHADGAATLRFADLTATQRDEFGLERESALAAESREARDSAEYEQRITREIARIEAQRKQQAAIESAESENDAWRAKSLARVEPRIRESPLAKGATPFGSGSIWRSSWYGPYGYYSDRRRTVTYYTPSGYWYPRYTCPSSSGGSSPGVTRPVEVRTPDPIRREVIR